MEKTCELRFAKCNFNVNHFHLILSKCTRKSHLAISFSLLWLVVVFSSRYFICSFVDAHCEMRSCHQKIAKEKCAVVPLLLALVIELDENHGHKIKQTVERYKE